MSTYTFTFDRYLGLSDESIYTLPEGLRKMVRAFADALHYWPDLDNETRDRFRPIMVDADAFISAQIYALFSERIDPHLQAPKLDKVKLLALKAKALKLKLEQENR